MSPALVRAVDKGPVVAVVKVGNHDRSAEAAAVGVGNQLGLGLRNRERVGDSVECGVLVVPEDGSVNRVGAAAGDDGDLSGLPKLGVVEHTVGTDF